MSWIPPSSVSNDYEEYNREENGRQFLGIMSNSGEPAYYVPEEHRTGSGSLDENGKFVTHPGSQSSDIDAEEKLGEYLERVGEEHGWDSLSEFAREHLEDEDTPS